MLFPILETKLKLLKILRVKGTNNTEIYEILIRQTRYFQNKIILHITKICVFGIKYCLVICDANNVIERHFKILSFIKINLNFLKRCVLEAI
jgi:hypothetical protein